MSEDRKEYKPSDHVLALSELSVSFSTPQGEVEAVRGVSLHVREGEILCLVGESGCGKTVLCQSIMHLLPRNGRITGGRMHVLGRDITAYTEREMRAFRRGTMSMLFQDPLTSLDPTIPIGQQIVEAVQKQGKALYKDKQNAKEQALELLRTVGIDHAEERFHLQPHFFSGGMRQRCVLAVALASHPRILFADEATTALDASVETKILDLLLRIRAESGIAVVFVSHDLGAVARIADRVAVMYAGRIVEVGTAEEVFYAPRHPYTWGLLSSLPALSERGQPLYAIPGMPPSLLKRAVAEGGWYPLKGDAFAERNAYALGIDYEEMPPMFRLSDTHYAATWLLHSRAPKIEPPESLRLRQEQIENAWIVETEEEDNDREGNGGSTITGKNVPQGMVATGEREAVTEKNITAEDRDPYMIEVRRIRQSFPLGKEMVQAVDGLSFGIRRGEVFGLVGESGCGKSTLARVLSGIYRPTEGEVLYEGERVTGKGVPRERLLSMRHDVQLLFQDSAAALDPRMHVEGILMEPLRILGMGRKGIGRDSLSRRGSASARREWKEHILDMLREVGLSEEILSKRPAALSGGQRQRVAIARSLLADPRLLIADEPVASLDPSIQSQILSLFQRLQRERQFALFFIAHDLSVVRWISDRVGVMLEGRLVELAPTDQLFFKPQHPYTRSLLSMLHVPDPKRERQKHVYHYDRNAPLGKRMEEIAPGHFVLC